MARRKTDPGTVVVQAAPGFPRKFSCGHCGGHVTVASQDDLARKIAKGAVCRGCSRWLCPGCVGEIEATPVLLN
jgi:transcription elongation factor Elf1